MNETPPAPNPALSGPALSEEEPALAGEPSLAEEWPAAEGAQEWARRSDWGWIALAALVFALALLLRVTPDGQGVSLASWRLPELCAVKRAGGRCPGCGMTRSFVSAAAGELRRAFAFHPAGPLLLALLLAQLPYRGARLWTRARGRPALEAPAWLWGTLLGLGGLALLGTFVARLGGLAP
ncbi:MAG: DUF2752 domain-containing protein [Planctomycetota bacterium]